MRANVDMFITNHSLATYATTERNNTLALCIHRYGAADGVGGADGFGDCDSDGGGGR